MTPQSSVPMQDKDIYAQFMAVYDRYAPIIFRLCFTKTGDRHVAEDLAQEAFYRTWDYLKKTPAVLRLDGLLFTVTYNVIKDFYKKKKAIPESRVLGDFTLNTVSVSQDIEGDAEISRLRMLLQEFDDRTQILLQLRFVDGWSVQDIATHLNIRQNTASARLGRATARLKRMLHV